jgi:hypothetical protein
MNRKTNFSLAIAFLLLCSIPVHAAPLTAGAGKAEIEVPPGMPLSGYGNRTNVPSTGVHDPVYARAVVLESEGRRAAVVGADILMMTRELKEDVERRVFDLDLDFLSISATHTHYSIGAYVDNKVAEIAVMGKYDPEAFEIVASALEQALREASANMKPAMAAAGSGPGPDVTSNRRHKGGPTDPTMRVLGIWDESGTLMAVMMNHAIHPTTMPSQTTLVSGDNAGLAEIILEEKHPGAIAIFMNGGEGDQSPDIGWSRSSWETVEEIGRRMAESADAVMAGLEPQSDVNMTLYQHSFDMPPVYLRPSLQCWGGLNQLFRVFGKNMMRDQGELMGLALNDALFLFSPAEISYDIQKHLEDKWPDKTVFVVAQSNDIWGYVITPEDYKTGGYESCLNFYGREFGPQLEREFEVMVKSRD